MSKKTINCVRERAIKDSRPITFHGPGEPDDVYFLHAPGWDDQRPTIERMVAEPKPRAYKAGTLDGLVDQVKYMAGLSDKKPVVFVGGRAVRVVLDENGDRRDRVGLDMRDSEPFSALHDNVIDGVDQRGLIWLLRTIFKDALVEADVLPVVRSLRFASNSDGHSNIKVGNESMGKSIDAQAAGADGVDIPETLTFRIPIYREMRSPDGKEFTADIECALDVNLMDRTFRVKPVAGSLESAWNDANAWITNLLRCELEGVATVLASSSI